MAETEDSPQSTLIRWIVTGVIRLYWLILIAAIASGYYCFQLAKTLKLDANIVSLMPDGVQSVENLRAVIEKTGGYSHAMILVESPDLDSTLRFLEDLRSEVLKYDWVNSAEYSENTAIFEKNRLLYADATDLEEIDRRLAVRIDYEKKHLKFSVKDTPVEITIRGTGQRPPSLDFDDIQDKYEGGKDGTKKKKLFQNKSGDLVILVVMPKGGTTNVAYSKKVIAQLEDSIRLVNPEKYHPDMRVELGGRVVNLVAKFDAIMSDIKTSAVWSLSAICLVVVLFYRRITSLLYIGIPLLIGFSWTFALTAVVLGGLNLITIFLVLILFGLGIDFGIHNLARYDEVRRSGGGLESGLATIYRRTGHASLLAAVTTIAGFFSLMVTDFRAFYEFGFIAGTGVAFTLLSMYLVFPALVVLAERVRLYRRPRPQAAAGERQGTFPFANTMLVVGVMASVLSLVVLHQLEFEDDFGRLKTRVPHLDDVKRKITDVFPLRSDKAVVFVETLEDVKAVVDAVESIRDLGEAVGEPTIEKVKSIYSVVPESEEQKQRIQVIDRIHDQLAEALKLLEDFKEDDNKQSELRKLMGYLGVSELKPSDLPPELQRIYTGIPGSGGYLVYIYNLKGTSKLDEAQAFVEDIREITVNGKTYYPATEAMIFVDMLNLMKNDASLAIAAVLIAIVITLTLAFRRPTQVLLVLIPVTVGFLWMLGIMAVLNVRLNVFNMVVLPTVLGIGIDNAIHIHHRYREEGAEKLVHVIRTTGAAAFLTTLTTMLGFAGTLTASNQGLQSLGLVACIGLGACMLSSLTLFPSILQWHADVTGRR